MLAIRCSSTAASVHELLKRGEGMLFLVPGAAKTEKELEFAFYLAGEAFKAGTNISGKMANEAMLYLACETNFSSAARKDGAKDAKDFVLVLQKSVPLSQLKKKLLLTKAVPLKLPKWGGRVGKYYGGELAVERMALARIRN